MCGLLGAILACHLLCVGLSYFERATDYVWAFVLFERWQQLYLGFERVALSGANDMFGLLPLWVLPTTLFGLFRFGRCQRLVWA